MLSSPCSATSIPWPGTSKPTKHIPLLKPKLGKTYSFTHLELNDSERKWPAKWLKCGWFRMIVSVCPWVGFQWTQFSPCDNLRSVAACYIRDQNVVSIKQHPSSFITMVDHHYKGLKSMKRSWRSTTVGRVGVSLHRFLCPFRFALSGWGWLGLGRSSRFHLLTFLAARSSAWCCVRTIMALGRSRRSWLGSGNLWRFAVPAKQEVKNDLVKVNNYLWYWESIL